MKIVVFHGQMHRGSTYNITKLFLDSMADKATQITEFFLPKDGPTFCVGCFNCFLKGEGFCPHVVAIEPLVQAIIEADLLIFESPCYVYGMTGQLKTFMDHLAYLWMPHRPHLSMFRKVGLVISTAAGAGAKQVTKNLKQNLFYWGVPKTFRYSANVGASSWETVNPKKKRRIEEQVSRLAPKIVKSVGKTKPGLTTKVIFRVMRLSQKANNWNPVDKDYWQHNGWLKKTRPW